MNVLVLLLASACGDGQPAGPPGEEMAFTSCRIVDPDLPEPLSICDVYVVNGDGSGLTNLTNSTESGGIRFEAWSPDGTRIAFSSYTDIFMMNADGSGVANLTNSIGVNSGFLAWSPDGTRIAVYSCRIADPDVSQPRRICDIYVVNADGSGVTNLTNFTTLTAGPEQNNAAWSADGTRVAFEYCRVEGSSAICDIHVVNADGSGLTKLANFTDGRYGSGYAWSPDGGRIAFLLAFNLYVANADGSGVTNLTNFTDATSARSPAWSPDGTHIAFFLCRNEDPDNPYLASCDSYVANADGSRLTNLSNYTPGGTSSPAWSPGGTRVAFEYCRYDTGDPEGRVLCDIYVVDADGSGLTKLTNFTDRRYGEGYAWSPDGSRIAFGTGDHMYVVNADGSGLTNLTDAGAGGVWSPDGSRIAFETGHHIYVVNADGSGLTNLTKSLVDSLTEVREFAWSPAP